MGRVKETLSHIPGYSTLRRFKNFVLRPTLPLFRAKPNDFEFYANEIGIPVKKVYRDYLFCCYIYGTRPYQYTAFDFYRLNLKARDQFACDVSTNAICREANIFHTIENNYFSNKPLFNKYFKEFLGRDYILSKVGEQEIYEFLKNHNDIIIKPLSGSGGKDIKKIDTTKCSLKDLSAKLANEDLIIEEVIHQCEEMSTLNESSINTVRVVTIRDCKGKVIIVGSSLRMGRAGDCVDNLASGGIAFPLDEDGYVCGKGYDEFEKSYERHPDSGKMIIGFQVPRYRELLQFTIRAMDVIPEQRLVGWDICIDAKYNLIMIEGNLGPESITFQADGIGKKDLLKLAITK